MVSFGAFNTHSIHNQGPLRYSVSSAGIPSSMSPYTGLPQSAAWQQQQQQQHHRHEQHRPHHQYPHGGHYARPPRLQSPPPPPELARGHLAQAKLRDAAGVYDQASRLPLSPTEKRRQLSTGDSKLPRPPSHSPWALWVGNVPSDATHAELWRFFTTRSPPGIPPPGSEEEKEAEQAEALFPPEEGRPRPNYNDVGIESIHLISRSNCCFVNMASKRHLDHAIRVCNGLSLRPGDPRCKNLVCRVRKKEDDAKTGVGAQRGKGIHQQWAADQEKRRQAEDGAALAGEEPGTDSREGDESRPAIRQKSSASTTHSNSTSSTTSSFLTRTFPKRYFILKVSRSLRLPVQRLRLRATQIYQSHTEDDLHLSVERGLWATQSHNEPVLDQAFRTSGAVYLIFGANKSGGECRGRSSSRKFVTACSRLPDVS